MMESILRALSMAFSMGWEILWPLILGFALSAVVQAVVSHRQMARLLPDARPKSMATALALGAASSSCSYAAVALARSLFRKGANFAAAMAFEMASTNLVLELSIIWGTLTKILEVRCKANPNLSPAISAPPSDVSGNRPQNAATAD